MNSKRKHRRNSKDPVLTKMILRAMMISRPYYLTTSEMLDAVRVLLNDETIEYDTVLNELLRLSALNVTYNERWRVRNHDGKYQLTHIHNIKPEVYHPLIDIEIPTNERHPIYKIGGDIKIMRQEARRRIEE